jgi:hypothetical protein
LTTTSPLLTNTLPQTCLSTKPTIAVTRRTIHSEDLSRRAAASGSKLHLARVVLPFAEEFGFFCSGFVIAMLDDERSRAS